MTAIRALIDFTFSLRGVVLLMALWLLSTPHLALIESLNQLNFDRVSQLSAVLVSNSSLAMIELPGKFLSDWLQGSTLVGGAWLEAVSGQWFMVLEKLVLVTLLGFVCLLVPRTRAVTALLSMLLISILLLALQQFYWHGKQQWLPIMSLLLFGWVATLLMLLWAARQRRWQAMIDETQTAYWQLAELWQQQGRLSEALACLTHCSVGEEQLNLTYRIAVEQEQKRQYNEAAETYALITQQDRHYKDASQRAKLLTQVQQPPSSSNQELTQTLAVSGVELSQPVLGRYEIERELGRGAMGVVYLGKDPKIARKVAIKTLNYHSFPADQIDALKERFYREAEAAGRLNHPNIVTIYDVGEERDLAYIAMDYVSGEPVNHFISVANLLPVHAVYLLIAEVADALSYAHQKQIVHRDIKPGNILYNKETAQVKVADFGIARIVDDSKTRTGDVMGSPIYMSPEQLKGSKVSGATDIYSLGVTFYQLLSGDLPFMGDSIANLGYQILNKKYKSIRDVRSGLPASAARIVNKAMQKDPAKRYSDAAEMAEALRKSLAKDFSRDYVKHCA